MDTARGIYPYLLQSRRFWNIFHIDLRKLAWQPIIGIEVLRRIFGNKGANVMNVSNTNTYDYQSVLRKKLTSVNKNMEAVKSTQDMTLEEYKGYINDKIAKIPFHYSHRRDKEYLTISEEGYLAMKNDPEYEAWVLEHIRENRSVDISLITSNPHYISGEDYEYIGATKESCHGESYNNWDYHTSKNRENKEAERKREREKALKKARKKALDKQYYLKQEGLRDLYERMADKKRDYSRYLNEVSLQRKEGEDSREHPKRPMSINTRAIKSYESSFVMDVIKEMGKSGF